MIEGGYILQPRCIDYSGLKNKPPVVREVWNYLLRNVFHHNTKKYKRGTGFFNYNAIAEELKWYKGYVKMTYSHDQICGAMNTLVKTGTITVRKTVRGAIISICKYDYYQSPKNYEDGKEGGNENPAKAVLYDKNDKNVFNVVVNSNNNFFSKEEILQLFAAKKEGMNLEFDPGELAGKFYDYNSTRGWMIGKAKIPKTGIDPLIEKFIKKNIQDNKNGQNKKSSMPKF